MSHPENIDPLTELLGIEEPPVEPAMARYWLVHSSKRAIEDNDGSIRLRPDQKPDDVGLAALAIAQGDEPQLFSAIYTEITGNAAPLHLVMLQAIAHSMVVEYQGAGKTDTPAK